MSTNVINTSGRYRSLIISIALFLALIGALLAFTFFTSSTLERNTALIDVSNSTANNAQAVIKDVFDLQNSYGEDVNSPHMKTVLQRLADNSESINTQLDAMRHGGVYADAHGHNYVLPAINDPQTLQALEQTQNEWNKLYPKIKSYLEVADDIRQDSSTQLAIVGEQAKVSSLAMNDSLEELTQDVFEEAEQQAQSIRLMQILGVAAIFAYFFIFIVFFLRRLRKADAQLERARRETTEIMETVNTGLFLLDKDLKIGQQHSQALEDIIGATEFVGQDFTKVLRGRISEKDLSVTRQFIEQLYNPRVKEKLVHDLNPLQKVMLHSETGQKDEFNRYLDFKFSRVYEKNEIARILVNVTDVSDAVKLEKRLEQERAQNDMQIEMLTTILNVHPSVINEFIVNTQSHIERINNVLKNPGSSQHELENKLNLIYREMHSLKGEASALKLHSFTKIATEAEDKLHGLRNQGKLSGNDFLPLAVDLDELLNLSNTIERLGERINQASPNSVADTNQYHDEVVAELHESTAHVEEHVITPAPEASNISQEPVHDSQEEQLAILNQETINYYQDFAHQIALRQHKKVNLDTSSLHDIAIPAHLTSVVKEITIQLLRNAIVHGIETPQLREEIGKPSEGEVVINMQQDKHRLIIKVQDDGQGINYDHIRQKLVDMDKYDSDQAQSLTKSQLLSVLFSSGFTTKSSADEDGGRGVGLDIIKDRVRENGGKLNVHSELGKMTQFIIALPLS